MRRLPIIEIFALSKYLILRVVASMNRFMLWCLKLKGGLVGDGIMHGIVDKYIDRSLYTTQFILA